MHAPHRTEPPRLTADADPSSRLLILAVAGLVLTAIGYFVDHEQFYFSYLAAFSFVASLALGSLFLVMIHHITRSSWAVSLRRIPETFMVNILWVAIMFIPVVLGMHTLYHWTHADAVAADALLQGKAPYLNVPFYLVRNVFFFAVWSFFAWKMYRNSLELDATGDWGIDTLQRKYAAPGIFIFGFSVAFASFDWLMSLDPHWFSTMFGVYFFAMSFQATLAAIILVALFLKNRNQTAGLVTDNHIADVGRLLFGFTVFYAYIAWCQFFLIYYANIPEETLWFYHRMEGGYEYITYGLLIGRFIVPFVVLLNAKSKSNMSLLKGVAIWVLFIHFVEQHWIVMPVHHHHLAPHWLDLTAIAGLGGLFLWLFFRRLGKAGLVAVNDPKFHESQPHH